MACFGPELWRSSSDRAVRRKPLVWSGQDVWVYGFSTASVAAVVAKGARRGGIGPKKVCISQACEAIRRWWLNRHNSLFPTSGHTCSEHGKTHARVAGFSRRSGRVISTCQSGFREEDLGSGESFDDAHRALAEGALPGSRLVRGRCIGCRRRLVEQKTAEWEQVLARAVIPGWARAKDGAKSAPWKTKNVFHFRTGPAVGCSHRRIMVAV
jgi:hypothetical protein